MNIQPTEDHDITLDDQKGFVESQDVGVAETNEPAYTATIPQDYVLAIDRGTMVAPEFRNAAGDKLDDSTRVIVMKADRRGNKLSEGILFDGRLDQFDYEQMRNDESFIRETQRGAVLNEHEQLHVYCVTPEGADTIDSTNSRFTLGDASTSLSKAVTVKEKSSLPAEHRAAIEQNTR